MDNSELSISPVPTPPPLILSDPPTLPTRRPRWERRVPKAFVISQADTRAPTSLHLSIELTSTDDGRAFRTQALIDSGATGSFIDARFVERNKIPSKRL